MWGLWFAIHRGTCETVGLAGDFHRPYETQKLFTGYVHRTTLPQLRCAQQLPQRGSRERAVPFIGVLAKPWGYGRFSSPLRNSKDFGFYHSSGYTPSASLRSAAPSEREPGWLYHPTGCSLNRGVAGDFHRPYERRFFNPPNKNRPPDGFRRALQFSWRGSGCS